MESGQLTTWDCVWFGSYPQSEIAPSDPAYVGLESARWDALGDATVDGVRYHRVSKDDATSSGGWSDDGYGDATYRYFRYEPVKWRVLETSDGTALVVADVALDNRLYNTKYWDVTWETCSLRSWLNGYGASSNQPSVSYTSAGFLDRVFSADERGAILETTVTNVDYTDDLTPVGNDTQDRVFLLNEAEVSDVGHGFSTGKARQCKLSDYARAMGALKERSSSSETYGNCWWLLRLSGPVPYSSFINNSGDISRGFSVNNGTIAVRPALNLNLSSPFVQPAGLVSSDGAVDESAMTGNPFADVTDDTPYVDDILWLADQKVSEGWILPDGTREFRPNANVKRGDMAAFLFRLAKQWSVLGASDDWAPEDATKAKFTDVNEETAHSQAIWWMAENGISAGWDVGGGRPSSAPTPTSSAATLRPSWGVSPRRPRDGGAPRSTRGPSST